MLMKWMFALIAFASALTAVAQSDTLLLSRRQIVFRDVNVVSMRDDKILKDQVVVATGGRITAVGTRNKVKYGKDAFVIDATGKYLLPGLAEMHAHVPPVDDVAPMKDVLMLFALNGITTIRGMLGHPKHLEVREKIKQGDITGPRLYTTGPSFNGMSVKSPEDGAAMVRRQKEAGYDFLKLHPGLTRQKFDAIAATAKEVDIPFVGHVSFNVGVWHAIEAGYSSIDHLDGFVEGLVPGIEKMSEQQTGLFGMYVADQADRSRIPGLMSALRKNNIWVVPTQALAERWFNPDYTIEEFQNDPHRVYMKPEIVEQWISSKRNLISNPQYNEDELKNFIQLRRDLILACEKNGVGLLLGCDAPQVFNVPGFSTHEELEYLVLAGLTPYQALRTGTVNVAKYLGMEDSGVIGVGAVSDLILLDGDPLADIRNTRKISGVLLGDQWMDSGYIKSQLEKLVKR